MTFAHSFETKFYLIMFSSPAKFSIFTISGNSPLPLSVLNTDSIVNISDTSFRLAADGSVLIQVGSRTNGRRNGTIVPRSQPLSPSSPTQDWIYHPLNRDTRPNNVDRKTNRKIIETKSFASMGFWTSGQSKICHLSLIVKAEKLL